LPVPLDDIFSSGVAAKCRFTPSKVIAFGKIFYGEGYSSDPFYDREVKLIFVENPAYSVVLTIAGFDPSSGAGVTADLKTFAAHGVYGVACVSAMTVQSTQGVRRVEGLQPDLVRETLDCLAADVTLAGIKIGMLGSGRVASEIADFLLSQPQAVVVVDPVLRSSSGAALIDPEGVQILQEELLPRVAWVTPNQQELAILAGEGPVEEAASRLQRNAGGALNVVVTGGHLTRPNDFLLSAEGESHWFEGEKILTNATHGTGCAFSSALLCGLVAGLSKTAAVTEAKQFVVSALRSAYPVGKGKGPMNHFFRLG
jgi:hydroxymethylpyrimidine/phosphomethylpyrimidine kinase